jgi:hypothetical protein
MDGDGWWRGALAFTDHALMRMQQRAVPEWVVAQILCHGETRHAGQGDVSYCFTGLRWRRLRAHEPDLARALERWRNVYVVLTAEGAVKTVARRHWSPSHAGPNRPRDL